MREMRIQVAMGLVARRFVVAALGLSAVRCASSVPFDRGVLAYDRATAAIVSRELLLNIARARQDRPMHFTAISNITATYRLSFSAGITPALTGDRGFLLAPLLGGSREESPTVSIVPMQGEEFSQRLLTPFHEQKVTMLLEQGYDVDALLRIMAAEIRLAKGGNWEDVDICTNRPSDREGYAAFRRVMAHLSSIQDRHALRVEPLVLRYRWTLPATSVAPDTFQSLSQNFSLAYDPKAAAYEVTKRITGRVILANYDPATLPEAERIRLNDEAELGPLNEILVDIRPGHLGGEYPLHGQLRLRSFHEVLAFLGRGIEEEPEYEVPPDPRTPVISENPVHALEIAETDTLPPGTDLSVLLGGHYYALQPQKGYQWNRKAFSLLYQLFQMTVSAPAQAGPAITISK
jgi:hypothetical protein